MALHDESTAASGGDGRLEREQEWGGSGIPLVLPVTATAHPMHDPAVIEPSRAASPGPNDALRAAREVTSSRLRPGIQLSRQELADLVNAWIQRQYGRTISLDANYIGKLERGTIRWPNAEYRAAMRAILGVNSDAEIGFYPGSSSPPTLGMVTASRIDDRQAVGSVGDETARHAAQFAVWAEATNVGPMTIHRFTTETRRLSRDYLTQDPGPVFARAAVLAKSAFDLIQGGHQHLDQTRDLHLAAGRLSALLSWMAGDLHQPVAASEHASVAWICAEQSGHPGLKAWALSAASKAAFWDGDYSSAAEAARSGQLHPAPGTALVLLACQEADALKAMGRQSEADHAIQVAAARLATVDQPDDIGGLMSCLSARQTNYAVGVHLAAHRSEDAINAALDAEDAYAQGEPWAYGTWAQLRIGQALAHLQLHDVDQAERVLSPVLAMPQERRLDPLRQRSGEIIRALGTRDLQQRPDARELAVRVDSYRRPAELTSS